MRKKDLEKLSDKTGIEIGLKEGDEIFLKLKEKFLKNISNDILIIDMNEAIALLNTITGETTSNEILNNIFNKVKS